MENSNSRPTTPRRVFTPEKKAMSMAQAIVDNGILAPYRGAKPEGYDERREKMIQEQYARILPRVSEEAAAQSIAAAGMSTTK
jgi:hypothetical protein